jgi:hypothetical protein
MGALLGGPSSLPRNELSKWMLEGSREGHLFPWGPHLGNQVGGSFPGPFRDKERCVLDMAHPSLCGVCEGNLEGGILYWAL